MTAEQGRKRKKLAATLDKERRAATEKANVEAKKSITRTRVKKGAEPKPDELVAKTQKALQAAQGKAKYERQARQLASQGKPDKQRRSEKVVPHGRQHYATFTVELLLDEDKQVRRTHITHIQSGAEDEWPRWQSVRLTDFLVQRAALRLPPAELATLATVASTLDKIATEIRHLQRTEVREAEEYFSEKQKGSSAMPHKRNPVTCEQISGLARVVRSNAQAGFENVALWHERDISHSSAERIIIPDSTTLADYLLNKTANLIETMFVYPERMMANLESTHGLVFSGQLLLDLVESGVSREDAYRLVQSHAMRAWKEDLDFHELILNDPEIRGRVPKAKIERAFDLQRQLKNIDKIFARVFPEKTTLRKSVASAKKKVAQGKR